MNRIYAIIIMLYCWEKTHSQEYIGIQQYHAPEPLHYRQCLNQLTQSTPRLILSHQQILRKPLLPYHHQLPYFYYLPSQYYQNASLQQENSAPPRYLLFYYNSFYHQNLPSYNLHSPQYLTSPPSYYNTSYEQKPSSGFLLFYYNTFYHQNSHSHNYRSDSLYNTLEHSADKVQQNHVYWKTTPLTHPQEGWSYSKMLALTSNCIAGKQKRTTSPGTQNLSQFLSSYNAFNSCIHSDTNREKSSACMLLNKLFRGVRNGTGSKFFQNQTYAAYSEVRLYIVKLLNNNLSSNGKVNGFSTALNNKKLKSKTTECNKGFAYCGKVIRDGDFSTKDWQHLDKIHKVVINKNDSKYKFRFARIPFEHQQAKDYDRTLTCPNIFKYRNKTYDEEIINFASRHEVATNLFSFNQISGNKKCSETADHMLDFQKERSCPIKCVHAPMPHQRK